jgi:hypothetical protein
MLLNLTSYVLDEMLNALLDVSDAYRGVRDASTSKTSLPARFLSKNFNSSEWFHF